MGIIPYFVFISLNKLLRFQGKQTLSLVISGVLGALTNTIFVLGFIYLFFAKDFSAVVGTSAGLLYKFLLALIATNGIPEAALAGVIVTAVCKAILVFMKFPTPSKIV